MKNSNYLPVLPLYILFLILCTTFFCINPNGTEEEREKNNPRNLSNKKTAFIYNVIPNDPSATISVEYSKAINTFSVALLNEVYKNPQITHTNVTLSPFSISRVLAVLTEGASGESKKELLQALGGQAALDDANAALAQLLYADNSIILQCADAIWVNGQYSLNQEYKKTVQKKYGVAIQSLTSNNKEQIASTINNWTSTNTNNYIKKVVDPQRISDYWVLSITNAIYFEADWTSPFSVTETRHSPFQSPTGTISVNMMNSSYQHKTRKTPVYENAKLYYGTGNKNFFYLDVYMPLSETIEEFLESGCLDALSNNDTLSTGSLQMPKFSLSKEIDLIPVLKNLGVKDIFDPAKADLSGILKDSTLVYVDQVKHVAGIKTDEEGTKAYTVTALGGSAGCEDLPNVILDKPFIFFIRAGQNGLVLFAGVVNNPNEL
jgi:serpin B